jgi:MYXO-CTERM domain-containing protein
MDVSPQTVAPGGVVSLHLSTSCKSGKTAKASAEVFVDTVTLAPSGDGRGMDGSAFIRSDAVEGSYRVSVECDGSSSSASASITVSASGGGTTPVTPLQPDRPVPAGGGGAAKQLAAQRAGSAEQLAAGPAAAGASTEPLLVTGAVAAAGLVGLAVHRRRRAARG